MKIFYSYDKEESNYIVTKHLKSILKDLSITISKGEINDFIKDIDVDKTGRLSLKDVLEILSQIWTDSDIIKSVTINDFTHKEKKQLKKSFNKYDKDGSGYISVNEFANVMKDLGMEFSKKQIKIILKKFDDDNSKKLDFNEFKKAASKYWGSSSIAEAAKN